MLSKLVSKAKDLMGLGPASTTKVPEELGSLLSNWDTNANQTKLHAKFKEFDAYNDIRKGFDEEAAGKLYEVVSDFFSRQQHAVSHNGSESPPSDWVTTLYLTLKCLQYNRGYTHLKRLPVAQGGWSVIQATLCTKFVNWIPLIQECQFGSPEFYKSLQTMVEEFVVHRYLWDPANDMPQDSTVRTGLMVVFAVTMLADNKFDELKLRWSTFVDSPAVKWDHKSAGTESITLGGKLPSRFAHMMDGLREISPFLLSSSNIVDSTLELIRSTILMKLTSAAAPKEVFSFLDACKPLLGYAKMSDDFSDNLKRDILTLVNRGRSAEFENALPKWWKNAAKFLDQNELSQPQRDKLYQAIISPMLNNEAMMARFMNSLATSEEQIQFINYFLVSPFIKHPGMAVPCLTRIVTFAAAKTLQINNVELCRTSFSLLSSRSYRLNLNAMKELFNHVFAYFARVDDDELALRGYLDPLIEFVANAGLLRSNPGLLLEFACDVWSYTAAISDERLNRLLELPYSKSLVSDDSLSKSVVVSQETTVAEFLHRLLRKNLLPSELNPKIVTGYCEKACLAESKHGKRPQSALYSFLRESLGSVIVEHCISTMNATRTCQLVSATFSRTQAHASGLRISLGCALLMNCINNVESIVSTSANDLCTVVKDLQGADVDETVACGYFRCYEVISHFSEHLRVHVLDKVSAATLTLETARAFKGSVAGLRSIAQLLQLSENYIPDVDKILLNLEELVDTIKVAIDIRNFVKNKNVPLPDLDLDPNMDWSKLSEPALKDHREELERNVKLRPEIYFFWRKKSGLFFECLRQVETELETNEQVWAQDTIDTVVTRVLHFLDQLVNNDKLTLADVDPFVSEMKRLGNSLEKELDNISDLRTVLGKRIDTKAIARSREVLTSATQLLHLVKSVNDIEAFVRDFKLDCDVSALTSLRDEMNNLKGIQVSHAVGRFNQVQKLLGNIHINQVAIFEHLNHCKGALQFLFQEAPRFSQSVARVNSDVQGDQAAQMILDNVVAVHANLRGLIEFVLAHQQTNQRPPQRVTLNQLCDAICSGGLATTSEDLNKQTQQLILMAQRLPDINLYFSSRGGASVETLGPYIATLAQAGFFQSRLDTHPEGAELSFYRNHDEREAIAKVEDAARGIKVFLSRDNVSERDQARIAVIQNFARVFELAQELHEVRLNLERHAHPDYQGLNSPLNDSGRLDVAQYEAQLRECNERFRQWTAVLNTASAKYRRLKMLTPAQLAKLLKTIDTLATTHVDSVEVFQKLLPFLINCFADEVLRFMDEHRAKSEKPPLASFINKEIVCQVFEETLELEPANQLLARNADAASRESRRHRLLKHAGEFLTKVEKAIGESDAVNVDNLLSPVVHFLDGSYAGDSTKSKIPVNDTHVFVYMHELSNYKPIVPSQVLWCDESTATSAIHEFIDRSLAFPHIQFFVSNIHLLNLACREALAKRCSEIYERNNLTSEKSARTPLDLLLVFTSEFGLELFNVLKREIVSITKDFATMQDISKELKLARGFVPQMSTAVCISGEPGVGKSYHIKREMKQLEQLGVARTITVTENFSPAAQHQLLSALARAPEKEGPRTQAWHCKVSGYSPIHRFSRWLYDLMAFGLFWQEDSPEMHALQSDVRVHVFVELNEGSTEEGVLSTTRAMLDAIPACGCFFQLSHITKDDLKLQLPTTVSQTHLSYACALLEAHGFHPADEIDAAALLAPPALAPNVSLHELFQRKLEGVQMSLRQQHDFLVLFATKCAFLKNYAKSHMDLGPLQFGYAPDVQRWNMMSMKELYQSIVGECLQLARGTVLGETQTPLIVTERTNSELAGEVYQYSVLTLDPKMQMDNDTEISRYKKYLSNPGYQPGISWRIYNTAGALARPSVLRSIIAHALGVHDTNRMSCLIEQRQYVFTPQLAVKILKLHQYSTVGRNLIFSGKTGTGKTELLEVYALLCNANSELVPNMLELVPQVCERLVNKHLRPRNAQQADKLLALLAPVAREDESRYPDPGNVEDCLSQLCDTPAVEENLANGALFDLVAGDLRVEISALLRKYTLLKRTARMEALLGNEDLQWKTADAVLLLRELLHPSFQNLFYHSMMHAKLTHASISKKIQKAVTQAKKFRNVKVVLFIDEFNTTQCMGLLKEVFCDRSLNGEELPDNLFCVAAMNPYLAAAEKDENSVDDGLVYSVRRPPKSMNAITVEFDDPHEPIPQELSTDQFDPKFPERSFEVPSIKNILDIYVIQNKHYVPLKKAVEVFYASHRFVLLCQSQLQRDHPSIRDVMRAFKLFYYFTHTVPGRAILGCLDNLSTAKAEKIQVDRLVWKPDANNRTAETTSAMIVTVGLVYNLRLPSRLRDQFVKMLERLLNTSAGKFQEEFLACAQNVYESTTIPPGIAKTDVILENLLAVTVCCDAKIPVVVKGPPGCSKTLSFTIASENAKGAGSPQYLWKLLHQHHVFRYQCSEHSTDNEIQAVYEQGKRRQGMFDANVHAQSLDRAVVFLDEGGLVDTKRNALKVIHYHLDHPSVATVICTNKMLDAAKSNRALIVSREDETGNNEILSLAKGIFGVSDHQSNWLVRQDNSQLVQVLEALCEAFREMRELPCVRASNILFQRRDFIHFMRHLKKYSSSSYYNQITTDSLLDAIERNLGGLPGPAMREVVELFFNHVNKNSSSELPMPKKLTPALTMIKKSLEDRLGDGESPNVSAWRYIMVIDPTENQTAIQLLQSSIFDGRPARVLELGDFPRDRQATHYVDIISQIKEAMAAGETVILVNPGAIQTSFYDVFNRHFVEEYIRKEDAADGEDPYTKTYTAKLAVGSLSKSCVVHPDFKIIVHVPESSLKLAMAQQGSKRYNPFLDRFEKYRLSVQEVFEEELARQGSRIANVEVDGGASRSVFHILADCALDMVAQLHTKLSVNQLLCATLPIETVYSLLLSSLRKTVAAGESMPSFGSDFASDVTETRMLYMVREFNFRLLQLARLEMIYEIGKNLPREYLVEYLQNQEHFSVMQFVKKLLNKHMALREDIDTEETPLDARLAGERWMVYTRSSGQAKLIAPKFAELLDGCEPEEKRRIKVLSLAQINYASELESRIRKLSPHTEVLLVLADTRECSPKQVSSVVKYINMYMAHALTVVINHFPPELSSSPGAFYNAIFLNGWDFIYIDYMTTSSEESNTLQDSDLSHAVTDARWWFLKACGLRDSRESADSGVLLHSFRDRFVDSITQCCNTARMPFIPPKARATSPFRDPKTYHFAVQDLLQKHPKLYEDALAQFLTSWDRVTLGRILDSVCKALRQGQLLPDMMHILGHVMRSHFETMVSELLKVFNLHNFEAIIALMNNESTEDSVVAEKELLVHILNSVVRAPPVNDPLTSNNNIMPLILTNPKNFAPELILFDVIVERLNQLGVASLQRLSATTARIQVNDLVYALSHSVKEHRLATLLAQINMSHELLAKFKRDFVRRVIGVTPTTAGQSVPQVASAWLSYTARALDILCATYTNSQSVSVLDLVSTFILHPHDLKFLGSLWHPLKELVPSVTEEELFESMGDRLSDLTRAVPEQVHTQIIRSIITLIWNRLNHIISSENHEEVEYEESILSWLRAARSLCKFGAAKTSIHASLPVEQARQLEAIDIIFNASVLLELPKNVLISVIRSDLVKTTLQKIEVGVAALRVLSAILDAVPEDYKSPELSQSLLKLVCSSLLLPSHGLADSASNEAVHGILAFLDLAAGEATDFFPSNISELFSKISSAHWLSTALYLFFKNSTERWRARLLSRANAILARNVRALSVPPMITPLSQEQIAILKERQLCTREQEAELQCTIGQVTLGGALMACLESYLSHSHTTLRELTVQFHETEQTMQDLKEPFVNSIKQHALTRCIVRAASAQLCNHTSEAQLLNEVATWRNPPIVLKTVTKILADSPVTQLAFLSGLPDQACIAFLKSEPLTNEFGLRNWRLPAEISMRDQDSFLYCLDRQAPGGEKYFALTDVLVTAPATAAVFVQTELALSKSEQETQEIKYRLRMNLVLALYREFLAKDRPCNDVRDALLAPNSQLVKLLDLLPKERTVYTWLSAGPPALSVTNSLTDMFARRTNPLCAVMVNILAVAMGTPSTSNHIYRRIFDIPSMKCSPGAGADNRLYYDCYYQTMANGDLQAAKPAVCGDNKMMRLAINTLVWVPYCWAILLFGEEAATQCRKLNHFVNYVDADTQIVHRNGTKGPARTEMEKVGEYLLHRASGFFTMLSQDPEAINRRIDGPHFLSECCYSLAAACLPAGGAARNAALVADLNDVPTTVRYEEFLHRYIFSPIINNYGAYSAKYQESATRASAALAVIASQRVQASSRLPYPIVPFTSGIRATLSTTKYLEHATNKGKRVTVDENQDYYLLRLFLERQHEYSALQHLPRLISFYNLLVATFGHRLSLDQAQSFTVLESVALLEREYFEKKKVEQSARAFRDAYKAFIESWSTVRRILSELENCPAAAVLESEIIPISEDGPLLSVLVNTSDTDRGAIPRLIEDLLKKQSDLLDTRSLFEKEYNTHQVLWDSLLDPDASWLTGSADTTNALFFIQPQEFSDLATLAIQLDENWSRESLSANWVDIQRVILRYTSGKIQFKAGKLIQAFPFAPSSGFSSRISSATTENATNTDDTSPGQQTSSAEFRLLGSSDFARLSAQLNSLKRLEYFTTPLSTTQKPQLQGIMESAKADDVQDLAKALGQMATNILDPNTQADSLFSSIVSANHSVVDRLVKHQNEFTVYNGLEHLLVNPKVPLKRVTDVPLACLCDLGNLLYQTWLKNDTTYTDFPTSVRMPLEEKSAPYFTQVEDLIDASATAEAEQKLESALNFLLATRTALNDTSLVNKIKIGGVKTETIIKPLRQLISAAIPTLELYPDANVDELFKHVKTAHYCYFLRRLQHMSSQIQEVLVTRRKARKSASSADGIYRELLPACLQLQMAPEVPDTPASDDLEFSSADGDYSLGNVTDGINANLFGAIQSLPGPVVVPLLGRSERPKGLPNVGNNCYMNAGLQMLAVIPELTSAIATSLSEVSSNGWTTTNHESFVRDLSSAVSLIWTSRDYDQVVDRSVVQALQRSVSALTNEAFLSNKEHDTHEWVIRVLDLLEASIRDKAQAKKLLSSIRQRACHKTTCTKCGHADTVELYDWNAIFELSMPPTQSIIVSEQIRILGSEQLLWSCPACNSEQQGQKQFWLDAPPAYLFIHLVRFNQDGSKNNAVAKYEESLDITALNPELIRSSSAFYQLVGASSHYGTAECGHWSSCVTSSSPAVKRPGWYSVSDRAVMPNTLGPWEVPSSDTTILLYKLTQRPSPPVPAEVILGSSSTIPGLFDIAGSADVSPVVLPSDSPPSPLTAPASISSPLAYSTRADSAPPSPSSTPSSVPTSPVTGTPGSLSPLWSTSPSTALERSTLSESTLSMSFALPQDVAHFRTLVIKSAAIKPDGEADICNWVKHRLGLDATNATVQIEPGVQAIVKFDATARLKKRALKAPLKMSGKAVTLVALAVEILQLEVESLDDVTAALHDEIGEDHVEHVEIVPGIENAVVVMLASEEGLLAALGVPSLTIGGSEFNISSV